MGHKHTFRGGTAWAPMRSQRTTDALGNYSSESHKFSQTSNYIPQPNQAKSPRAWSSPEETARRVALLQHPPMCCWRGCRAQLSFACPGLRAVLSHIPSLFPHSCRHRCPPSLPFLPTFPSTKPRSLQTCPAPAIACPRLHPALGNPAAHGRLCCAGSSNTTTFSSKGMSGLATN